MHIPKYRKNPDGRAFVEYRKRRVYLGRYGTPASEKAYREFVSTLMETPSLPETKSPLGISLADVVLQYLAYAQTYYQNSGEWQNVRVAVVDFTTLCGEIAASDIGPSHLLAYQRHLIANGYSRRTINARCNRVKRCVRWLVSRELLSPTTFSAISTVDGLRAGRSEAVELPPVPPVDLDVVEATLPYVAPVVATMIRVQFLCGMRPDEVCSMRACDIDRSSAVWLYRPQQHKSAWRGKTLIKAIPSAAQELLSPWITGDPGAWLFSPVDSKDFWNKPAVRKATKRARYTSASYGKSIVYAIRRAARNGIIIPHWSPNQLRHSIAGEVSQKLGQQAAQRWLGHARLDTTAIYAELNADELRQIAEQLSRQSGSGS